MFAKRQAKTSGEVRALSGGEGRKAPRAPSLIGADVSIEGDLKTDGDLHVDGVIRGEVRVGRLTLGETGHIQGAVFAETVEAHGRIVGSITARTVRLFATAHVDGDVSHEQLSMDAGAFFQGRSLKAACAAAQLELVQAPAAE